jgi:hypothetical protein
MRHDAILMYAASSEKRIRPNIVELGDSIGMHDAGAVHYYTIRIMVNRLMDDLHVGRAEQRPSSLRIIPVVGCKYRSSPCDTSDTEHRRMPGTRSVWRKNYSWLKLMTGSEGSFWLNSLSGVRAGRRQVQEAWLNSLSYQGRTLSIHVFDWRT